MQRSVGRGNYGPGVNCHWKEGREAIGRKTNTGQKENYHSLEIAASVKQAGERVHEKKLQWDFRPQSSWLLSVSLSLSLSVCLSFSLFLSLSVSLCLSLSLSACLSVSLCLSVFVSLCLSFSVPVSLFLWSCLCLSVCLSPHLSLSLFLLPPPPQLPSLCHWSGGRVQTLLSVPSDEREDTESGFVFLSYWQVQALTHPENSRTKRDKKAELDRQWRREL